MAKTGLFLVAVVAAATLAGCGGAKVTTTTNAQGQKVITCANPIHFARTKFLLHSGLAFGAFHRYILKPYRAGSFKKGAPGRTKALAKAAASGLFAYHELKIARADAVCDGPTLKKLSTSVSNAVGALGALGSLKSGAGLGAIGTAAAAISALGNRAASSGTPIKDVNH